MPERATLYEWLRLEEIKERIFVAVEDRNKDEIAAQVYQYLSTATNNKRDWSELSWLEIYHKFLEVEEVNTPTKPFPILRYSSDKDDKGWTYEGRDWYYWLHVLSSNYSWDIDYIKELDIDDAIGLLQEILIDEQSDREFLWGMSELAYEYNENTKKSKLRPLDRPKWMQADRKKHKKIKKTKIRRDFMPLGNVVTWKEDAKSE